MHDGKRGVHRFDQVAVYDGTHVLAVHRHIHAGGVISRRLVENILLDVSIIGLRNRVDEVDIGFVIRLEPGFPFLSRARMQYEAVHAVAHLHFFAAELSLGEIEVCVIEHGEHRMKSAHDIGRERKKFFLSFAQNVRLGLCDFFRE